MARRNRKYAAGVQWIRLLPAANQSDGDHTLLFVDESKRQHTLPVHTTKWTPYAAEMIDAIKASPLSGSLDFSQTQPEETN